MEEAVWPVLVNKLQQLMANAHSAQMVSLLKIKEHVFKYHANLQKLDWKLVHVDAQPLQKDKEIMNAELTSAHSDKY